jgi:crotonobetainyl-CoA:carnitine CoA-transferase CaiB-like acyl-CoA transferase
LSLKYPKLIFADILGYGENGPDKDKPGFDYTTFYARTGLMVDLAPKGQDILNTIPGFGDHVASIALAAGICAALYRRNITGQGDRVDAGLFQTGIFVLSCGIMAANFGREFPRSRLEPNTPISASYKCKDGEWIYLAATDFEKQWEKLCREVFNRHDLAENEKFNTFKEILKCLPEVVGILDEIFLTKDSYEWVELLKKADVAHERVQHFADIAKDEQAWANDYIREYTYPSGKKVIFANSPVTFKSIEKVPFNVSGAIGRDTDDILTDLGYSTEQIEKMKENKDIK